MVLSRVAVEEVVAEEALVEPAVVPSGGLEHGAVDAVPEHPVAECAAAGLVVLELTIGAEIEDVGVELRLAEIATGDYDEIESRHSCVPVLVRFGA